MSRQLLASHEDVLALSSGKIQLDVPTPVFIDQKRIMTFAEATGDFQWIHVDAARAQAGPFKKTIAHGKLIDSLAPGMLFEVLGPVRDDMLVVNIGDDKTRFISPVLCGSSVSMGIEFTGVEAIGEKEDGSVESTKVFLTLTLYVDGSPKPACVTEVIYRFYW